MINIKNRYLIIKKLYPNYLILIIQDEKYFSFNYDKLILKYLKFKKIKELDRKKIPYLILNNLEIYVKKDYIDSKYDEYLLKSYLSNLVIGIGEQLL